MKNIVFISGSPRNGNTEFILHEIKNKLNKSSLEIEFIKLRIKKIAPCYACNHCKKEGMCISQDDMPEIIEKIKKADIIVLGTPSYFYNVTGITKNFIDRFHPIYTDENISGKKFVSVYLGGDTCENTKHWLNPCLKGFVSCLKLHWIGEEAFSASNVGEWNEPHDEINNKINKLVKILEQN